MAKLKISERPEQPIAANDLIPFAKIPAQPGLQPAIKFADLRAAILNGFTAGMGVVYDRTPFTDELGAVNIDYSITYRDLILPPGGQPVSAAGQVAQIQNTSDKDNLYEIQQNLLVDHTVSTAAFTNLNSVFKRLEVVYTIETVLYLSGEGEKVILRNFFIDSFQRTSEAIELRKQFTIDHQINFILKPDQIARITNQTIVSAVQYDFANAQVTTNIGTIRVTETSDEAYLNTKIFS